MKMAALARQFLNKLSVTSVYKPLNGVKATTFTRSLSCNKCLYSSTPTAHEVVEEGAQAKLGLEIISKVKEQVAVNKQGRLFAIVHICGKQWRVTEGDVIVVEGYWPPTCPDRISLDKLLVSSKTRYRQCRPHISSLLAGARPASMSKMICEVLLVGSRDFTLVGRPLIQRGLANIEATVIEKTLSHTKTHFKKRPRKQYMRTHFIRVQHTMLRINKVELTGELDNPPEVTDAASRV